MDGKKRASLATASQKALMMLEAKAKHCKGDTLLENCVKDAQSCFNLSNDPYWKNVEMYLRHHFDIMNNP